MAGWGDSDKEDAFSVPGQIKHLFSDKAVMKLREGDCECNRREREGFRGLVRRNRKIS